MNPRVKLVKPGNDYKLEIIFTNNEKKIFDLKPYLDFGAFSELKDKTLFNSVTAGLGTVIWKNGLDICPDTLYLESK